MGWAVRQDGFRRPGEDVRTRGTGKGILYWLSPLGKEVGTMRKALTLLLLAAATGCGEGGGLTSAGPDGLGKQIVAEIARVAGEEPHATYPRVRYRPLRPLNLSEIAIVDFWEDFGDPGLAEELATYARGEFPGTLMDCDPRLLRDSAPRIDGTRRTCLPFSQDDLDDLPPDGMLMLSFGNHPQDNNVRVVLARHYYPVRTPNGVVSADRVRYVVELERMEDGSWKVGEGGYLCCA